MEVKNERLPYISNVRKVLYKDLCASYISTQDQRANIFTKGLTSSRFLFLIDKLMFTPPSIRLRRAVKEHEFRTHLYFCYKD
jgi:hypothetical protein